MKYVDVIIDNQNDKTDQYYTYQCEWDDIAVGDKVLVPFALGKKLREAYIFQVSDQADPRWKHLKQVAQIDRESALPLDAIPLCHWMKDRYFCRYSDAMNCFTPPGAPSKRGKNRIPDRSQDAEAAKAPVLTREQSAAMEQILPVVSRQEHQVFLIHGVTSSGKTELYLRTIQAVVEQGRSAILLVPEISLTPQTIQRLIDRFGDDLVAILHSKLSAGERHDQWMRIRRGEAKIVVGARSAVFAPVSDLGTLIIDEEHDTSYKSDMTPKYDTIEIAIQRAIEQHAVVLLGSATPSVITTWKAEQGLYQRLFLRERYNQNPMPQVSVIDMREELREGNRSIFSRSLLQAMEEVLAKKQQIILFLNRRGYSSFLSCRSCGFVLRCSNCGISMTYHKAGNQARCHFCGLKESVPKTCPSCQSPYFRHFGTGTEKVEEHTRDLFPDRSIARLDLDTTRLKGSMEKILGDFRRRKTDILIGTQLVAKGLDFEHVGLVGIIAADLSLHIPDFRSPERTFQLITQASGRSGRGQDQGRVLIQSYTPDHFAITSAADHDYEGFYHQEILLRSQVQYPPFSDLVQLILSHEREETAQAEIQELERLFLSLAGLEARRHVLGPQPAPMSKVNGIYRFQLLIKCVEAQRREYLEAIRQIRSKWVMQKKQSLLIIDVNPYSFV